MSVSPQILEYVRGRLEYFQANCFVGNTTVRIGLIVKGVENENSRLLEELLPFEGDGVTLVAFVEKLRAAAGDVTRKLSLIMLWKATCLALSSGMTQRHLSPVDRSALVLYCGTEQQLDLDLANALYQLLFPTELRS